MPFLFSAKVKAFGPNYKTYFVGGLHDKAVMDAYGFNWRTMTKSDCVAELFKLYQKLTSKSQ